MPSSTSSRSSAPTSPATRASAHPAVTPPTSFATAAIRPPIASPSMGSPRPRSWSTWMDRASIGPAPPARERARTPPAAARSAWPDACIREPAMMATPSEGCARTARPVRAYKDGDLTQMCVHLLPAGTQIAKFSRRRGTTRGIPTQTRGTRYSDRPASHETRLPHARAARQPPTPDTHGLTPKARVVKPLPSPSNRSWPAARPRKPTRVRLS